MPSKQSRKASQKFHLNDEDNAAARFAEDIVANNIQYETEETIWKLFFGTESIDLQSERTKTFFHLSEWKTITKFGCQDLPKLETDVKEVFDYLCVAQIDL